MENSKEQEIKTKQQIEELLTFAEEEIARRLIVEYKNTGMSQMQREGSVAHVKALYDAANTAMTTSGCEVRLAYKTINMAIAAYLMFFGLNQLYSDINFSSNTFGEVELSNGSVVVFLYNDKPLAAQLTNIFFNI